MEVKMRKLTKEDVLDEGHELKLIDLSEIPDDVYVFSSCGTGGGVQSEMKLKWSRRPMGSHARTQNYYTLDRYEAISRKLVGNIWSSVSI
jgi:hypothetical protein